MAHRAIQRQPANNHCTFQALRGKLAGGDQRADGDWKIIGWSFFADVCGGEVDSETMSGDEQARILDGGLYTVAGFHYRCIRQPHDNERAQASVFVIDFNLNEGCVHADDGARVNPG